MTSPFLTLQEAALYARCSPRTIQRWLAKHKLRRHGRERKVLIRRDELEHLLSPISRLGGAS